VILGVYSGRGKRTGFGVGGLLVGVYDEKRDEFVTISRVGTGLTDEEFRKVNEISQHLKLSRKPARVNSKIEPTFWIEPKVVLEIFADEITRSPIHTAGWNGQSGFALRFPRLVKFREADKRPEDATSVFEIKKMYSQQYKRK
jgi:DNA ligase-1